jgi:hypothetical protein
MMHKEKRKYTAFTGSQTAAFILLWSASYAIGFGTLWLTLEQIDSDPFGRSLIGQVFRYWDVTTIFLLFGLTIPGLVQMLIIKRFLQGSPRGWISLTSVGIIISWVIVHLTRLLVLERRGEQLEFLMFALFMPVSLAQTIWLTQHIKRAWLWPLVSLIGTIVFLAILIMWMELSSIVIGAIVYGLLMGIAMFYLHIDVLWHAESFQEKT